MKRIKTTIVMLLTVAMLLMPIQAFAAPNVGSVRAYNARCASKGMFQSIGLQIVELANIRIETIINESIAMGSTTNDPAIINGIVASMLVRTSAVSGAAQVSAALCGVMTACEWVDVTIGCGDNAVTVSVDPLRVVLV